MTSLLWAALGLAAVAVALWLDVRREGGHDD